MRFPRHSWLLRAPAEPGGIRSQPSESRLCVLGQSTCDHPGKGPSLPRRLSLPSLGASLHSGKCLDIFVSEFCLSCFVVLFALFFLTRKLLIVSPSATILALMSHKQRILSLCSPECAWRQFSRRRTKTTLAISTVHSRFRNVTRHVHPCPGKGLLADPHLTSAGRGERQTLRGHEHTHRCVTSTV